MKKLRRLLAASLVINLILLCLAGMLFWKSGSLGALLGKLSSGNGAYSYLSNTQYEDRKTLFAQYQPSSDAIVFIGDSIIQRCDFGELFGVGNVCNRGIGSDTTEGVLNRLDEIIAMNPSKIFIMIGINDIAVGIGRDKIKDNYNEILSRLLNELPDADVFVLSILPTRKGYASVSKVNSDLYEMSTEYGYAYIDLYDLMIDDNEDLRSDLTSDGIHLNGSGYAIFHDELSELIMQ